MERLTEEEKVELSARNEEAWQDFWDSAVDCRLETVPDKDVKEFLGIGDDGLAELESYCANPTIDQIKRYLFLLGRSLHMDHSAFEDRNTVNYTFEAVTNNGLQGNEEDDLLYDWPSPVSSFSGNGGER